MAYTALKIVKEPTRVPDTSNNATQLKDPTKPKALVVPILLIVHAWVQGLLAHAWGTMLRHCPSCLDGGMYTFLYPLDARYPDPPQSPLGSGILIG
jgi:hypothetical protein